ncbi:hypothetical protein [Actinocorallia longicatena]|uniref:Uncharacterized protein n=1 Tax=Actinocorallia longicatena TaxID=111803 RepID=A0ABP6QDS7_9ACTN
MGECSKSALGSRVNVKILAGGGLLIGIGGMIGLAGVALAGSALMSGARRWVRESEVPPREMARRKLGQAMSAANAGRTAWQNESRNGTLTGASR